jgi:hypothetical protein
VLLCQFGAIYATSYEKRNSIESNGGTRGGEVSPSSQTGYDIFSQAVVEVCTKLVQLIVRV